MIMDIFFRDERGNQMKFLFTYLVFLLAVASVILNTYAVGYGLSFKYAVICSPILTMAQAFLTLPFRLITE